MHTSKDCYPDEEGSASGLMMTGARNCVERILVSFNRSEKYAIYDIDGRMLAREIHLYPCIHACNTLCMCMYVSTTCETSNGTYKETDPDRKYIVSTEQTNSYAKCIYFVSVFKRRQYLNIFFNAIKIIYDFEGQQPLEVAYSLDYLLLIILVIFHYEAYE